MNKITLTFLGLCLTFISFGQGKNQEKWERVISEMKKANEGDTITLRSKPSLEWTDFKKSPELDKDKRAHLELIFGVSSKKVNVWTGVITVESYGGIRRDLSWINSQDKSQQLLDYLQLKYEIAHYYAKKSEKEINRRKINAASKNKINRIIETYIIERDKTLEQLDIESDYGKRTENINEWKHKLHIEEL